MALQIDQATIMLRTHPDGTTAEIHFRIQDETAKDLARSGVIRTDLTSSLRGQLATIVEDALRAAGKL